MNGSNEMTSSPATLGLMSWVTSRMRRSHSSRFIDKTTSEECSKGLIRRASGLIVPGFLFLAGICFLWITSLANALMLPVTLNHLIASADLIIRGTVLSQASDLENETVSTITVVEVEQVIKGASVSSSLPIKSGGGSIEGTVIRAEDEPRFVPGEQVILFLHEEAELFRVVEKFQGKFSVQSGRVLRGSEDFGLLADFLQRVRQSL